MIVLGMQARASNSRHMQGFGSPEIGRWSPISGLLWITAGLIFCRSATKRAARKPSAISSLDRIELASNKFPRSRVCWPTHRMGALPFFLSSINAILLLIETQTSDRLKLCPPRPKSINVTLGQRPIFLQRHPSPGPSSFIHLRKVIHEACPKAEEALKWGMPAFMYNGKILCGIAGFKAHCALWFWRGSRLRKPKKQKTG